MTDATDRLLLPYILADQAQKHVTHNAALVRLDALVQLAVLDRDRIAPPAEPTAGARHIVAAGATGAWVGADGCVAVFQDGAWMFLEPQAGWRAWCVPEEVMLLNDGSSWQAVEALGADELSGGAIDRLGVNTGADEYNRFAIKTSALLISHDDVSGSGNGSVLGTLNKQAIGNDTGFSLQNAWSTRALVGLFGDDDFRIKVSADGETFQDAMVIAKDSGRIGIGTASPATAVAIAGTGSASGLSIEDTAAASVNGRWNFAAAHDAGTGANNMRLINAGAGFGAGGIIAEFRKTASGAPRIGFCGTADDSALAAVANNLNTAAANGIKIGRASCRERVCQYV